MKRELNKLKENKDNTTGIGTESRRSKILFTLLFLAFFTGTTILSYGIVRIAITSMGRQAEAKEATPSTNAIFVNDETGTVWEVESTLYKLYSPAPQIGGQINLNSQTVPYPLYLTEEKADNTETISSVGGYIFNKSLNELKTGAVIFETEDMFMTANSETSEIICWKNYKGDNENVVLIYTFSILSGNHWEKYKDGVTRAIIPEIIEIIDSVSVSQK